MKRTALLVSLICVICSCKEKSKDFNDTTDDKTLRTQSHEVRQYDQKSRQELSYLNKVITSLTKEMSSACYTFYKAEKTGTLSYRVSLMDDTNNVILKDYQLDANDPLKNEPKVISDKTLEKGAYDQSLCSLQYTQLKEVIQDSVMKRYLSIKFEGEFKTINLSGNHYQTSITFNSDKLVTTYKYEDAQWKRSYPFSSVTIDPNVALDCGGTYKISAFDGNGRTLYVNGKEKRNACSIQTLGPGMFGGQTGYYCTWTAREMEISLSGNLSEGYSDKKMKLYASGIVRSRSFGEYDSTVSYESCSTAADNFIEIK